VRTAALAIGLLAVVAAGCGGSKPATLVPRLDDVVHAGVPGALVLLEDGDRTQTAAVGYADLDPRVELRPTDRFRIGSVTKTFVATVVLQLAAEHRLRLDDPVSRWLPRLLPDGRRITLRDLLSHRSGLADVADDPTVLAGLRSEWSGRVLGRYVHGYSRPSHQGVVDPAAEATDLDGRSARWAGAAGDLVASAPDLARFFRALLGGELLPAAQLHAMETVRSRYGLGLGVFSTACGRAWGHTGNLNGLLTIAWSSRDGRRQAIVMANSFPLTAAADVALRALAVDAFCGG
jgi:D-alanyl-D-alanine carboxypeptidase